MDIPKVLAELQQELTRIDEAIASLERLQRGIPRRGRPPRWLTMVTRKAALAVGGDPIGRDRDEA